MNSKRSKKGKNQRSDASPSQETKGREIPGTATIEKEGPVVPPEKLSATEPVNPNSDVRDQPSTLGTPISYSEHTPEEEAEVLLKTPVSPLGTPNDPKEPENLQRSSERAQFPFALSLRGSKRRVLNGLKEQVKARAGKRVKGSKVIQKGLDFAEALIEAKDIQWDEGMKLDVRIDPGRDSNITLDVERVFLPRDGEGQFTSLEQLEDFEEKQQLEQAKAQKEADAKAKAAR